VEGEVKNTSRLLNAIGLKLVLEPKGELTADELLWLTKEQHDLLTGNPRPCRILEPVLLVANQHAGLLDVFAGSVWAGSAAAGGAGWVQALRRAPWATVPNESLRFAGVKSRVTKLSLQLQFGLKFIAT
jgi:hypothetical protein